MPDVDPTHYRLNDLKLRWRQDPSSRLFLQLADEHRKLGQHEGAVEVLEQGLEHRPNDLSALVALGRCQLELERVGEAVEPLEAVVSRDPTHIVASKLLIEAHLQQGDVERAGDRLRTYRLLNDRDPELAHLEYRLKRLQEEDDQEAPTVAGGELVEDSEAVEELPELELLEPESREPVLEPEAPEPEQSKRPELLELERSEPELLELERSEPELLEPEALEPEVSEPEALEPEVSEPEALEPEELEPEAFEPEFLEPEASESASPEPEALEPASEPESKLSAPAALVAASSASEVAAPEASGTEATVGGDPFPLAGGRPSPLDFGALWEQLPEPEPAPADPFLGLLSLDARRHWTLLSEEGIFASPPGGNGGGTAVALVEEPAPIEVSSEAPAEPEEIAAEPEPEEIAAEPEPEEIAEPEAIEPVLAVEAEDSVIEPEAVFEPVAEEEDLAAGAPEEPSETAALPVAGAVAAAVVAAGAAAISRQSSAEVEPTSEPAAEEPEAVVEPEEPAAVAAVAPEVQAEEPPQAVPAEEPATATLGELYLKQGHRQEAKEIFRRVLEQDPGNRTALESLARLEGRSKPLSAADLLAVRTASGRIPEGLTAKKVLVLGNYSKHLRAAARRRAEGATASSSGTGASETHHVR